MRTRILLAIRFCRRASHVEDVDLCVSRTKSTINFAASCGGMFAALISLWRDAELLATVTVYQCRRAIR